MIEPVETAENWGAEPWRKPTLGEDDIELFSEPGRVLHIGGDNFNTDYRSHWFVLAQSRFGGLSLLVKHGGGQRRVHLGYEEEHLVDWMHSPLDARACSTPPPFLLFRDRSSLFELGQDLFVFD